MSTLASRVSALSEEKRLLLAQRLKTKKQSQSIPSGAGASGLFPLSSAQQRLWVIHQMDAASARYNLPAAVCIRGKLDVPALERSFHRLIERHSTLRTTFPLVHDEPRQLVHPTASFSLDVVDVSGIEDAALTELTVASAKLPFNLLTGPLFRAQLLRRSDDDHLLLLNMHHIVSDNWSAGILVREIGALYTAFSSGNQPALPPMPIAYPDYAVWQNQQVENGQLNGQLAYWTHRLSGELPVLNLPSDLPVPPEPSDRGAVLSRALPPSLTRGLRAFSQAEGITAFVTLLSVFKIILARYSGQNDIIVGTPVSSRTLTETRELIGCFVNTVALRTDYDASLTFRHFVHQVGETSLGAFANQDVPFENVVESIQAKRDFSRSPVFQTAFGLRRNPVHHYQLGQATFELLPTHAGTCKFDLMLEVEESGDDLTVVIEYSTDLFSQEMIGRIIGHFHNILEAGLTKPDTPVGLLPMLGGGELAQLQAWNNTSTHYPLRDQCLHEIISAQAARTPDAAALVFDDRRLSYRDLERLASQLAHRLHKEGVGPNVPVAVFMHRSVELVVALLGTLMSGAAYVPIDPDYPADRIEFMLSDSQAPVLLTQQHLLPALPSNKARVIALDSLWSEIAREPETAPVSSCTSEDLAYIIYTSGSTGRPKGAMNAHRGIVNRLLWMQDTYRLNQTDRILQKTPFSFDVSVWEFFWPLMTGATLVLAAPGGHRDSAYLAQLILHQQITTLHFVPSMLQIFLDEPALARCTSLRRVICSGEALPYDLQERFFERCSAELHNLYGPTEAAVDVTFWPCKRHTGTRTVPIGHPIANIQVYILDAQLQPVPIGVAGELYIGGVGVGLGYVRRPELTATKFLPDPFSGSASARLYRTGDLARYLPDGAIEYLGRLDHQVKIRGFRIELGEIESVLNQHPAVRESVLVAAEDGNGGKRLVAYCAVRTDLLPQAIDLQHYLEERLPEYMVPGAFVLLDSLPLSPNGKVDRRALPEPELLQAKTQDSFVAPRTPEEQLIAGVWREVLKTAIDADTNFFELGGNSLLATKVVSRIRSLFQLELPVRCLFEHPTVARLASHVITVRSTQTGLLAPPLISQSHGKDIPLSAAQKRLWFLDQLEPGSPVYHIPFALRLTGNLNTQALNSSLSAIVARHDVLRTTFPVRNSAPFQKIDPVAAVALPVSDLSGIPADTRDREAESLALEEVKKAFDLAQGPLFRARLLRLSETEHILLLTMHHIIADGWSISVLLNELANFYAAHSNASPSALRPLRVQYADYSVWQKKWFEAGALEPQLAYWRQKLAGVSVLSLPADHPRPKYASSLGGRCSANLPGSLWRGLEDLSRQQGTTTFMTCLAAFSVLLSRYSGQTDIPIGSPIAGRNRSEVEDLIGFFVNTLVLRVDLSGNPSFRELLARTREICLAAYANQDVPFETLVEDLQPDRTGVANPLFQVMFHMQDAGAESLQIPGLSCELLEPPSGIAKFDLTLSVSLNSPDPQISIEFNSGLFNSDTAERMLGHYRQILESISRPEVSLSHIPLLTKEEQAQILVNWNQTASDYPRDPSLTSLFEALVAASPHALAVAYGPHRLSYAGLNQRANQIAHHLIELGVRPGTRVGIYLQRSTEMIAATVGVLKAGGAYVPLDLSYPQDRLTFMMEDSAASLLLTQEGLLLALPRFSQQVRVVPLESIAPAPGNDANPQVATSGDDLAYVMYTSGSTGRPKGIAIPQRAITRLVRDTNYVQLHSSDRVAQASNVSFDAATFEIWGALLNGASLIGISKEVAISPAEFAQYLRQEQITTLFLTTALFNQVAREDPAAFSPLRNVLFGGEAVDAECVRRVLRAGPPQRLLHVYGPTECTTFATWHLVRNVPDAATTVPIGRPVSNTTAFVLDPSRQPVPIGVTGELYIGGDGLALGYLNDPHLTSERFIPNPFCSDENARLYRTGDLVRCLPDGAIEFLGRLDQQVKIRGFRIELKEIESVLAGHPAIRECVVADWKTPTGDKRLVAYVVPHESRAAAPEDLRDFLKKSLPEFMIPAAFITLPSLPLTVNGKVDRRALPSPEESGPEMDARFVAPRTPLEMELARIWSEVLAVKEISVHDNFFAIGGHSLLATQVISRVRESLKREIPLRRLFELPAIADFCAALEQESGDLRPSIKPRTTAQNLPLSYAQQRLWFLDKLIPGTALYNVPGLVRLTGQLNGRALELGLQTIVERHEALRTTFPTQDGKPSQVVSENCTVTICHLDLSHLQHQEREERLLHLASDEARLPFSLSSGPLLRATLIKLSDEENALLFVMHHIVCDGWSMGVFLREFAAAYRSFAAGESPHLPALAIQYGDFAIWQRNPERKTEFERQIEYWKNQLGDDLPALQLPTDRPRLATPTFRGSREQAMVPPEVCTALHSLGETRNATLFMTLQAAFNVLLSRYTGQIDIVVGSPIAGRNSSELEPLIGFFVNSLVLRNDLSGDSPFTDLLTRVRSTTLEAYAHQDVPFELVVDALQPSRDLKQNPLFQVAFVLQNSPEPQVDLPGLKMTAVELSTDTVKFDLTLVAREEDKGLALSLEYNSDLFDPATIQQMLNHLTVLLESIAAQPQSRLSELAMLTEAERRQLLVAWNETATPFAAQACAHQLFEAQALRTPQLPAVVWDSSSGGSVLSYAELNRQANQLAHRLRHLGVGPESITAIALERSPQMIVAILAVLKAGGAYLPLALEHPADRLQFVLQDAAPQVLLTQTPLRHRFSDFPGRLLCLDSEAASLAAENPANLDSTATAANLAYVIYTSGSTGRPKGVLLEHRGLCNLAAAQGRLFQVQPECRVLQFAAPSFDASVSEIFVTLLHGGTLCLAARPQLLPGPDLLDLLHRQRIQLITLPPSVLAALPEHPLPHLRTLVAAGEACPPELVQRWAAGRRFLNAYGPTEATVCATAAECRPDGARPPIGRPLANARIYLVDAAGQPVPVGVPGEIWIGGAGVARGYLNRPALNAERFSPDPFAPHGRVYKTGDRARYLPGGSLEYLGRLDNQLKIRGFRIEPGEIEAVLRQHPAVRDAAVIDRLHGPTGKHLVAYVAAWQGAEQSAAALRRHLSQLLPDYMIPAAFVWLDQLPLTPHGKLDRNALPAPLTQHGTGEKLSEAPRNAIEKTLAEIWSAVLGAKEIGVNDNFFELGGDSILSIQIVARANSAGIRITPSQLFSNQTIASLAAVSENAGPSLIEQGPVTGQIPLSPIQHWFFEQDLAEPNHWNQSVLLELHERLQPAALEHAFSKLVKHHDMLRVSFERAGDGWRQSCEAAVSSPFSFVSLASKPASERMLVMQDVIATAQASFHLNSPPLMRAIQFDLGETQTQRLFITIHHLAIDGVSWRILLEDLHTAYQQIVLGEDLQLPPKTTSFKTWSERLHAHVQTGVTNELAYWTAEQRKQVAPIPRDFTAIDAGCNVRELAVTITVSLNAEETAMLLQEVPKAYRTQVNDVLLTALLESFARWSGQPSLLVDLEGHGREAIFEDVDLTRTAGWFTTVAPVLLELPSVSATDSAEALKAVKEQLRQVPHSGFHYGLLRYLSESLETRRRLGELPQAEVSFNYLGQFNQNLSGASLFGFAPESAGTQVSPRGRRRHLIEFNGRVMDKQLEMACTYGPNFHRAETIQALLDNFVQSLRGIIRHSAVESTGVTPSDFPLARLDQKRLAKLSRLLNKNTKAKAS